MIITEITNISKHKMRVSLDGEPAFVLTDRDILHRQLREGKELDESESDELLNDIGRMAARTAMDLLVKRDYTEAELRQKLMERGYSRELTERGIAYVQSYHYLDDERCARQLAESGQGMRSRQMMIFKMKQKGISDDTIHHVMGQMNWSDEDGIRREIHRKFGTADKLFEISEKEKQKFFQSLMRKGYSYSDINRVFRSLNENKSSQNFDNSTGFRD